MGKPFVDRRQVCDALARICQKSVSLPLADLTHAAAEFASIREKLVFARWQLGCQPDVTLY